ncbi:Na+/H+ antiporter NhaC family protein [Chakrabartyella piscis]|uniref:Na+/H+ antiporter NhaC family protein n=1 Tax=Chakrabartyella piscis TaxID=2918914 RepID=UPI0029587303|nr:Na+/H+ antiporter NhaC family protein [Chakrabartyella piscis]
MTKEKKEESKDNVNLVQQGELKQPSLLASAVAFASVIIPLIISGFLGTISIHACLILSTVLICIIGKKSTGASSDKMMGFMSKSIEKATFGLWFFVAIGAIIGTWMLSGTVPAIIYYGLGFLTPQLFVPLGFVLCSVTALSTGSSWTTIGTVGVALMGIGEGLGVPVTVVAAIVVGGATFGDKMSPISDIPNLACMGAGSEIYETIRAMMITMMPSYIIAFILYTILGFKFAGGQADMMVAEQTREVIANTFNLGPIVFLPIILIVVLNLKKVPPLPSMAAAVATAMAVAVFYQGQALSTAIDCLYSGYFGETGSDFVDQILNRGGLQSMFWSFTLTFLALSLGGLLDRLGFISVIIESLVAKAKSVGQLSLLVVTTSVMSAAAFADTYMPIVLNGTIYKKEFDKRGLKRCMLARLTSEGVHMWAPLMVWNGFGAFAASALGITPDQYIQYAYLNIIVPFVSVGMSFMGLGVMWNNPKNKGKRKFADVDLSEEPVFDD